MKKSRKAALTALLFSVAMNMNGCVYGPPIDEDAIEARREESSSVYEDSTSSPDETVQSDDGQKEQKL